MKSRLSRILPFAGAALVAVVASCTDDGTSPDTRLRPGIFGIAPSFAVSGSFAIDIAQARVLVQNRGTETTVRDTVVAINEGDEELDLSIPVLIGADSTFLVTVFLIDPTGDTVFQAGPDEVMAVTANSDTTPPQPVPFEFTYVGTGADALAAAITSSPATMFFGDTATFVANALDAQQQAIAGTPFSWTSSDSNALIFEDAASGFGRAGNVRGRVSVTATTPTGINDTTSVLIQPTPNQVAIIGDGQTGSPNTPLSQPIVMTVTAADQLPISGIELQFALTGGGSVAPATVTTDSAGIASVVWTVGPEGPQTLTVNPVGFDSVSAFITATSEVVQLPPAGVRMDPIQQPLSVGDSITISARVVDSTGTTVATDNGSPIVFQLLAGGLPLPDNDTTVTTVNGIAAWDAVADTVAMGWQITATLSGFPPDTSNVFNIDAATTGPVAGVALDPIPQPLTLGDSFAVVARAVDSIGQTVLTDSGSTVTFQVLSGGVDIPGAFVDAITAAGVATVQFQADTVASDWQISATLLPFPPDTSEVFSVDPDTTGSSGVVSWINPAGGTWHDPANWSTGTVPTNSDTVFIDIPGTYTVVIDTVTSTVQNLFLGATGSSPTLQVNGFSLSIFGQATIDSTATLEFNSGTLRIHDDTVTVFGTLALNGGFMRGNGHVLIDPDGTLNVDSLTTLNIRDGLSFRNKGTAHWFDGQINTGDSTEFINDTLSLFRMYDNSTMNWQTPGLPIDFINYGELQQLNNVTKPWNVSMTNTQIGTINSDSGSFVFQRLAHLRGSVTIGQFRFVQLTNSAGIMLDTGLVVTGEGTLGIPNGGSVIGPATLTRYDFDDGLDISSTLQLTGTGFAQGDFVLQNDQALLFITSAGGVVTHDWDSTTTVSGPGSLVISNTGGSFEGSINVPAMSLGGNDIDPLNFTFLGDPLDTLRVGNLTMNVVGTVRGNAQRVIRVDTALTVTGGTIIEDFDIYLPDGTTADFVAPSDTITLNGVNLNSEGASFDISFGTLAMGGNAVLTIDSLSDLTISGGANVIWSGDPGIGSITNRNNLDIQGGRVSFGYPVTNFGTISMFTGDTMAFDGSLGQFNHQAGASLSSFGGTLDLTNAGASVFDGDIDPSSLDIIGDFTQGSGAINIFITGSPPAASQLNVTGQADLSNLNINVTGIQPGDSVAIATFGSRGPSATTMSVSPAPTNALVADTVSYADNISVVGRIQLLFATDSAGFGGGIYRGLGTLQNSQQITPEGISDGFLGVIHPHWSPDYTRITYSARATASVENQLHIATFDGFIIAHPTSLGDTTTYYPRFSPHGLHLAFMCGFNLDLNAGDVCVMTGADGPVGTLDAVADGSGKVYVTDSFSPTLPGSPSYDWNPLNPDQLYVSRDSIIDSRWTSLIHTVNFDGTGVTLVNNNALALGADTLQVRWLDVSPDGSFIVFSARRSASNNNAIFRINTNGTGLTQLTTPSFSDDETPTISPDGTTVLYFRNDFDSEGTSTELMTVPAGGGAETSITGVRTMFSSVSRLRFDWSPDGNHIALTDIEGTGFGVYVVPSTTTAATYLTDRVLVSRGGGSTDEQPSWRP